MFTVGEFSRIARVSKRLLRYYDQIGLVEPAHSDVRTGRRLYQADQLSALNRILALKDLGLLLEDRQHGLCYCICHAAHDSHRALDLELGCHTSTLRTAALELPDGLRLLPRLLPAVDAAATTVVRGPLERIILGYGQIGEWAERNGYRTVEGAREVSLHLPVASGAVDYLTEIQQPVEQVAANNSRKPRRRRNVDA